MLNTEQLVIYLFKMKQQNRLLIYLIVKELSFDQLKTVFSVLNCQ